jgi:asparagine synthase (glutamine-hydrolysing)
MCGIAGVFDRDGGDEESRRHQVLRMLSSIRYRGPDQAGMYLDAEVGLGSVRLSIVDLETGQQPISNEDGTRWIVFSGEIFNYKELRADLEKRGHKLSTKTDTEVIVHLYEEHGPECLNLLNGQFAIAIWDADARSLFLARDRFGIRPLFYRDIGRRLYFGSEIKAILAGADVAAELDLHALDDVFAFWCPVSPKSADRNIHEVPPGHYLVATDKEITVRAYWQIDFANDDPDRSGTAYLEEFGTLLTDATRLRLQADVPVAVYLSGGIDSSTIAALAKRLEGRCPDLYSIAFANAEFDESVYQQSVAGLLGGRHHTLHVRDQDIGAVFGDVVWHTEMPIMRTAPAPMFLLSKVVRDAGVKVVLTGEGADEILAGYDIFKEALIRRFWAREPQSRCRPLLLKKLYSDTRLSSAGNAFVQAFFAQGLSDTDSLYYSHQIRWKNTSRTKRFFSTDLRNALASRDARDGIEFPIEFSDWGPLAQAQYLEIALFFSQYLLSAQGDRPAMAHSVETRMPFLDHRLVEFASRMPATIKMCGLNEKQILKKFGRSLGLPEAVCSRQKRPYRAPVAQCFVASHNRVEHVWEAISPEKLRSTGLFDVEAVTRLVKRLKSGNGVGETDEMALVGILSTQLWHEKFVSDWRRPLPLEVTPAVKLCGDARGKK